MRHFIKDNDVLFLIGIKDQSLMPFDPAGELAGVAQTFRVIIEVGPKPILVLIPLGDPKNITNKMMKSFHGTPCGSVNP